MLENLLASYFHAGSDGLKLISQPRKVKLHGACCAIFTSAVVRQAAAAFSTSSTAAGEFHLT